MCDVGVGVGINVGKRIEGWAGVLGGSLKELGWFGCGFRYCPSWKIT